MQSGQFYKMQVEFLDQDGNVLARGLSAKFVLVKSSDAFPDAGPNYASAACPVQCRFVWKDITYLKSLGIVAGFPDGNFYPDALTTRAQASVMIAKYPANRDNFQPPSEPTFTDVPSSHGTYRSVEYLANSGSAEDCQSDVEGNQFCPNQKLTRLEFAKLIKNIKYVGQHSLSQVSPSASTPYFEDVPQDNEFADLLRTMYEYHITEGCSTNGFKFCPSYLITRWQGAAFISRLMRAFGL